MTDYSQLSIASAGPLFDALKSEVVTTSSQWFQANEATVSGYLQTLAQAALNTAEALAAGKIGQEQATMILGDQKAAFRQTIDFTEYMTLVLAQRLVDGVFSIIGWTIFKHTGINLFPDLVKP